MHITIKRAESADEFKQYYHLRWKLLRAPWRQPEGSEIDAIEELCVHLAAVTDQGEVIGVARLQYNSDSEAQIRYMAVTAKYERQGIGRQLLKELEIQARTTSHHTLILDARETAIGFYQKQGFDIREKSYLLFDEIQHFRMSKEI